MIESYSQTITIPQAKPAPALRMRLVGERAAPAASLPNPVVELRGRVTRASPLDFSAKLDLLIKHLQQTPLLSIEEQAFVKEWQEEFINEFGESIQLGHSERDEEISLALCMLLCGVIHPAIDRVEENSASELQLNKFEALLTKLLEESVPKNEEVESFIDSYEDFSSQKKLMNEQLAIIEKVFDEKIGQFYAKVNELNASISGRYDDLRGRLSEINNFRVLRVGRFHNQVAEHAERIEAFFLELENFNIKFEQLDSRIMEIKSSTLKSFEKYKKALARIK